MDQLPSHQHEVEKTECGQHPAEPGEIQHQRQGVGELGEEEAPHPRPRQHDEQQSRVDEIAHVENDEEETAEPHQTIISLSN